MQQHDGRPRAGTRHVASSQPWRFARLLSAPHRLGFFAGAAMLGLSALWWALMLGARSAGVALPWALPPPLAHALVMSFGFMPLFIVGFLFTAGPRWLGLPEVTARSLLAPVGTLLGGWALAWPGFHLHAALAALGVALGAAGWGWIVVRWSRLVRASRVADRLHARCVLAAATVGAVAWAVAAVGLAWNAAAGGEGAGLALARAAALLALWGFLAPTFSSVAHRMIPFFSASALPVLDAWRPNWLLAVMLTTLALQALIELAQALALAQGVALPAALHAAAGVLLAGAAALMGWLAIRWGLVQSLRIRLLAMLHGGFAWLGIALALSALSQLRVALGGPGAALGLAPLHALTMGYLGATLLAMATRVAAGHSGRPLAADDLAWALYWTLQLGAVLRVAGALWPAAPVWLLPLAASAWAVACCGWALRYGAWMGRPRIDGRPG